MNDPLTHYFDLCEKGEAGVMPYIEGQTDIEFVWTNNKGYGRKVMIGLRAEGKVETLKRYKIIEGLNPKDANVSDGEVKP